MLDIEHDEYVKMEPKSTEKVTIVRKGNTQVTVRWFDGYLENFECEEVRFGSDLLWMRLTSKQNRHIPTKQVRWYSITPESHE